jgi:ABC-type branched-subunit amino acid transport system substrate-binding protein
MAMARRGRRGGLLLAALVLVAGAAACTEDSGDDDTGGRDGGRGRSADAPVERSGLLADDGPCDTAAEPYLIGIMTVFESPVLSLVDQVDAADAAVEAFNARGGIGGHCMDLTTCDTGLDPNGEVDCARGFVDDGIVATVHDTTAANPEGVIAATEPAGLPRIGIAPGAQELGAANSFPIGGGSSGTTIMMLPTLARAGHTEIAMVHVDTPQVQALPPLVQPLLDAYGAEITEMIPVPAGTTDYQQFVLAAQDSGATGVALALGEAEAVQVLRAAEQLSTDLVFSASLGTFGQADLEEQGDFAGKLLFNSEVPPVTASTERWPILGDVIADLEASGKPELQRDQIKASAVRSWLAVDALVQVVEQFGEPDDISREAITAAFESAQDVDLFGLVPAWTPRGGSGEGLFGTVSNPYYYQVGFDPGSGEFVIDDEELNLVEELAGTTDYPQPDDG